MPLCQRRRCGTRLPLEPKGKPSKERLRDKGLNMLLWRVNDIVGQIGGNLSY
jgi:hypothetical protein